MAGRPLTKFKKVDELNHSAFGILAEMFYTIPKQHMLKRDLNDANCAAWVRALGCVIRTVYALDHLTERLAEKAGQERYSPLKDFLRRDDIGESTELPTDRSLAIDGTGVGS